jgi:hypothetical protein
MKKLDQIKFTHYIDLKIRIAIIFHNLNFFDDNEELESYRKYLEKKYAYKLK